MNIERLRNDIDEFLRLKIHSKPGDELTKRDELTLATCETLDELLIKYQIQEAKGQHVPEDPRAERTAESVTSVLRGYAEINREYDLQHEDINMATVLRAGRRSGR